MGHAWLALASAGASDSAQFNRCHIRHKIRCLAIPMERRIESESLCPLVLRHAYQSETRRYTPRRPERTLLYRTVAENLETLLRTTREQNESGHGLPKYVEQEFREYLCCGIPCHEFTRLACQVCGRTIFLSFSCKRRGCCSSCAARRMCNTAAVEYTSTRGRRGWCIREGCDF